MLRTEDDSNKITNRFHGAKDLKTKSLQLRDVRDAILVETIYHMNGYGKNTSQKATSKPFFVLSFKGRIHCQVLEL